MDGDAARPVVAAAGEEHDVGAGRCGHGDFEVEPAGEVASGIAREVDHGVTFEGCAAERDD